MNRKYKLPAALDVDDLLMECTSYAIRLANEKHKFDPPMTIHEKKTWGKLNAHIGGIGGYSTVGLATVTEKYFENCSNSGDITWEFGRTVSAVYLGGVVSRGYLKDLAAEFKDAKVKGEVALVIAGANPKFARAAAPAV